jgi:hypothetical protein
MARSTANTVSCTFTPGFATPAWGILTPGHSRQNDRDGIDGWAQSDDISDCGSRGATR